MSAPVALPLRLPLDRRAVQDTGRMRAAAATVAIGSSVWLAAASQGPWLFAAGAFGAGFAAVWLARGLRQRHHALEGGHDVLLDHEGIHISAAGTAQRIGWADVVAIDVDEDRLMVRLQHASGADVWLEPHYGQLGVYDLCSVITAAAQTARSASAIERG